MQDPPLRPRSSVRSPARSLPLWILAAAALFLPVACRSRAPIAADQPVSVRLRAPNHVHQPASIVVSGEVEANVTALCAFQVPGRVTRVLVEEGQPVRKGQVLAELDAADARNAYDAARGQSDAAVATDRKAQAGLRAQELEQARIELAQAQDQYTRMKFLYDHASLPAGDFNKVESAYRAAQQRYAMASEGTRAEDKQAAVAQVHAAAAQTREAAKRLADTRLLAPIAGQVGMRRLDVGNTVAAGSPVVSVLDLDPVKVRVGVPEAQIGKVHQGARAIVTIPALDGRAFEGRVEAVGVAADPAARTYVVKIAVPNPRRLLRAGMVSEARIFAPDMVDALTVPGAAIVHDAQGVTQVYVYDAARRRAYARRVEVGALLAGEVEIRSGLEPGEQVVVAGQQNLQEGSLVRVVGGAQ